MHPILFRIPFIELPIYSYGVMLGLSLVVGWYLVMYLSGKDGLPKEKMNACFIWTAASAILGSRALYVLTNLSEYQGEGLLDMLNMRKGGLVAYGGFLGGFLGSLVYLRIQKISLLAWADAVVPTLCTGLGITRIGCLMFGCDYGRPIPEAAPSFIKALGLRFPNWEVAFPDTVRMFKQGLGCMQGVFQGAPAFDHHLSIGLAHAGDAASALVYPTQIMESVNGWFAFGLVMLVRKHLRFRGQAFLFFTAYYGVTRFLMEFLRGDVGRGGLGEWSTSQIVGMSTFAAAAVAYVFLFLRAAKNPGAAMSLGPGADPKSKPSVEKNAEPQAVTRTKKRKK
jgi:phosphatidylglycerol:prolipoprotein diacylglycerol transferase